MFCLLACESFRLLHTFQNNNEHPVSNIECFFTCVLKRGRTFLKRMSSLQVFVVIGKHERGNLPKSPEREERNFFSHVCDRRQAEHEDEWASYQRNRK